MYACCCTVEQVAYDEDFWNLSCWIFHVEYHSQRPRRDLFEKVRVVLVWLDGIDTSRTCIQEHSQLALKDKKIFKLLCFANLPVITGFHK